MVETDARTAPDQTIAEMNASVIATTMFWLLQPPGRPCYLRIDHRRGRSARRHSPSRVIVSSLTLHEVVKPEDAVLIWRRAFGKHVNSTLRRFVSRTLSLLDDAPLTVQIRTALCVPKSSNMSAAAASLRKRISETQPMTRNMTATLCREMACIARKRECAH